MSGGTEAPTQNLPDDIYFTVSGSCFEANEGKIQDIVVIPADEDRAVPVTPTLDADEATSGVTNVQPPFSLADHDVERNDTPSNAPLLVRCPRGSLLRIGFASCDLAVGSWQLLPSSALLPDLPADFAGTYNGIYSGGGLVLMEKFVKQEYHLVVSNPMSKLQHQLPPMMDFLKPEILGIFLDPATASYKIPVVQRKFNEKEMDLILMQEYNSASNAWEFAGQWRNRHQVEPIGAAYVNGTLFFLTYDRQAHIERKQQRTHHIYYLHELEWERLELPLGLCYFGFPAIFEHKGRLMLAGGLHEFDLDNADGPSDVVHSVFVWHHDWSQMMWMDVCDMPGPLIEELYKCAPEEHRRCTLEVSAGGNFVCVASSNGKVVKCDITKNDWTCLPKCNAMYPDGDRILILERRPKIHA